MYSLAGYGLLTPASNKIFLLVRFALVGSISLQALQMKVLILLHTLTT